MNVSTQASPAFHANWRLLYVINSVNCINELKENAVRENDDRRREVHSNLQRRHGGFIINKLITLLPFRVFALIMKQMTPLIRNDTLRKSTDLVNRTLCFI